MKAPTTNHSGRVYFAAERLQYVNGRDTLTRFYRATIRSGDNGRILWETGHAHSMQNLDADPEVAFDKMCAHAGTLDRPTDVRRFGRDTTETLTIEPGRATV